MRFPRSGCRQSKTQYKSTNRIAGRISYTGLVVSDILDYFFTCLLAVVVMCGFVVKKQESK